MYEDLTIDEANYDELTQWDKLYTCNRCSFVICDRELHEKWHESEIARHHANERAIVAAFNS